MLRPATRRLVVRQFACMTAYTVVPRPVANEYMVSFLCTVYGTQWPGGPQATRSGGLAGRKILMPLRSLPNSRQLALVISSIVAPELSDRKKSVSPG